MKSAGALLIRANRILCALPIAGIGEIMRPLPIKQIAGVPAWIDGLSIIRGVATPIINLGLLLGSLEAPVNGRFVTLRMDGRATALAVEEVVGLSTANMPLLDDMPPVLRGAGSQTIAAIGTLDAQLLLVLQTYRIIPDDVWHAWQE